MLHVAFAASWLSFLFVLYFLKPEEHPISLALVGAFTLAAVADIALALRFRSQLIDAAVEILRSNPEDAAAIKRWRAGNIMSFTFAECLALFGVVLKFLGAEWKISGPFLALGLVVLLLWTPKLDVSPLD